jgi:gamma-glutamylcyclotransferase
MKLYFAYGSNMWADQMRRRCPQSTCIGKALLSGYRWIITTRGYASIVASVEDEVYGIVYTITRDDELSLDAFEGVATGSYLKRSLTVVLADKEVECLVYIDPVTCEGKPHDEYIERINRGLKDAYLPRDYVTRYIRKFVPSESALLPDFGNGYPKPIAG